MDLIVGILAVLKAGAAYVPLDTNYPDEQLAYMLADSGATVLIVGAALRGRPFTETAGRGGHGVPPLQLVHLDDVGQEIAEESENLESNIDAGNLAYVIYTSGSTGRPKGVCCHHSGVINLLADFQRRAPLGVGDNGSLWTSVSFDVSVYKIFSTLLSGATLHIVPDELRSDFDKLGEWLSENRITSAYLPPAMLPEVRGALETRFASVLFAPFACRCRAD